MDKGVMHNGVSCPRVDPKLTTTGIPGALEEVRQFAAPRIAKRKPAEAHSQMIDLKKKKMPDAIQNKTVPVFVYTYSCIYEYEFSIYTFIYIFIHTYVT
jgi:hypothetical protein